MISNSFQLADKAVTQVEKTGFMYGDFKLLQKIDVKLVPNLNDFAKQIKAT